jgi:DNA-binding response OmpR family regulator
MEKIDKKVLIAEDEEAMLNALETKFSKEGFTVFAAHDGEEGFNFANKEHPDIILLDIIMPKIDGIELVKRIREVGHWGKEVPIIMLTNLSDPESVSVVAKYGVFDFLVKTDWRLDDVVKLVRDKLHLDN